MPTDDSLTETGLPLNEAPEAKPGRILLIACGALAREILAVTEANGWSHIDLTCLPAIYHNHPEKIAPATEALIRKNSGLYDRIFVVYADCGTGGQLRAVCDRHDVEMVAGPHCYAFFEGNDAFAARDDEISAFYLTDFLVRQFDAFIWKPLGLDRHPELRDSYFGHYTKLVYQTQIDDAALKEAARQYADRLGLAFEHRKTGYGELATTLAKWADPPASSG